MKRWITFGLVCALAAGALWMSQVRKPKATASPDAILHFIADTERELGRLPFELTRLSDEEEVRIGDEIAARYGYSLARPSNPNDVAIAAYVERVGRLVAARAQRQQIPYRFHYIPGQNLRNAFALPGGHIYLSGGLLLMMDSEDQLAAVLGHEIAHVDRYHCAERVQIEARTRHLQLGVIGALAQLPLQIFQAGYTKTQELEADRVGSELAARASYSPLGMIRLFEKFQQAQRPNSPAGTPQDEAARVVLETLGGYFRSHPYPEERIAELHRLAAQNGWETRLAEKPLGVWAILHPDKPAVQPTR